MANCVSFALFSRLLRGCDPGKLVKRAVFGDASTVDIVACGIARFDQGGQATSESETQRDE